MSIAVRSATIADAERIARFVTLLGYPVSASQMRTRLEPILADGDYATLVACDRGEVVGFIGTRIGPLYESDGLYGQIMALAIANDWRRRGTGRALIEAAESMLAARGARVVLVTSGHQRADAHAFYEKSGYTLTGRRTPRSWDRLPDGGPAICAEVGGSPQPVPIGPPCASAHNRQIHPAGLFPSVNRRKS